jgi:hypothetical protein
MSKKLHIGLYLDEDLYNKLWEITKHRFTPPAKKLSVVIREALQEYVKRHS